MCLAIPGKLVEWIERKPPFRRAALEFGGVRLEASMECVPEADLGDYVLVHAGVALRRIDPEEAKRTFEIIESLGLADDELGPDPSETTGGRTE